MPRELLCVGPRQLEFREYKEATLKEGEVRIRSDFGAAKHGTEMQAYKGYGAQRGNWDSELTLFKRAEGNVNIYPSGPGNMIVGTIIETGAGVKTLAVGDRALCYGSFKQTHVKTPEGDPYRRCWKVPSAVAWQSAVCLDPADFAAAAVRDGNVRIGDAVAIFSMGAIGLAAVQLAKMAGASPVIALDPIPIRLEAARALGADVALDPSKCDAGAEIKKLTNKRGVDVAIEYSGSVPGMMGALRAVAFGGTVVAGAAPPAYAAGLDFGGEAHLNRPNIIFSRACSEPNREHPRWNETRIYELCWRLICDGKLKGEQIVTPVVAFDDLVSEYPKIETHPESNIKLGVKFS